MSSYVVSPVRRVPDTFVPRLLFILKHRDFSYADDSYGAGKRDSGLSNSVRFVVEMLATVGIHAASVEVQDNNGIDRAVASFQPTHVLIEALWVVPAKFAQLIPLHPTVRWIVHLHSELPFLANEGMAIQWLAGYMRFPQISIAANSKQAAHDLRSLLHSSSPLLSSEEVCERVMYLPNYYPLTRPAQKQLAPMGDTVNVGCFSAVRPMKNQVLQAAAAIHFARLQGKRLCFHINATRVETAGENVLSNLRALFAGTANELVEHSWLKHEAFLSVLLEMDLGMQVSLSETFCIVAADMVSVGLPIVVSREVRWASELSQVSPTNLDEIAKAMAAVTSWPSCPSVVKHNQLRLMEYSRHSREVWENVFSPVAREF